MRPGSARAKSVFLPEDLRRESAWNTHFVLVSFGTKKGLLPEDGVLL